MAKRDYSSWDKQDLIARIHALEKRKKYGLVWDEERTVEVFDGEAQDCLPILEQVPELVVGGTGIAPPHLLIEGDNYHALSVLSYTHEKSVDVIYIDPPYNTGNKSWKYNNRYVERDDAFRHSKWLSFMRKRLKLARQLLKSDGIIVIAIDDYELNTLGLLANEVFGEANRLGIVVVESKPSGRTTNTFFSTSHEYYYFYAKSPDAVSIAYWDLTEDQKEDYQFEDDVSQYKWRDFLRTGGFSTPEERPNSHYSIYYNPEANTADIVPFLGAEEIEPIDSKGNHRVWRRTRPSFMRAWEAGDIQFVKNDGAWKVQIKDRIKAGIKPRTVWSSPAYDASANGTKLLEQILGSPRSFEFPKSLYAVKDTLDILTRDNQEAVVVDFFAGSGTTAHAVMELNRDDGGTRQCILVTNNENSIMSDVCYPRVKNVMEGYEFEGTDRKQLFEARITLARLKKANEIMAEYQRVREASQEAFDELKGEFKDGTLRLWGINRIHDFKPGLGGSLKYFKTAFVPAAPTDENKENLMRKSVEMLCFREGTFDFVTETPIWKTFRNAVRHTVILFDQTAISVLKKYLDTLDTPVSVYVFSLEDDDFSAEFADMPTKVKPSAIPEAILRVYRRIYG